MTQAHFRRCLVNVKEVSSLLEKIKAKKKKTFYLFALFNVLKIIYASNKNFPQLLSSCMKV